MQVSVEAASGSAIPICSIGLPTMTYSYRPNTPPTWIAVRCPAPMPMWVVSSTVSVGSSLWNATKWSHSSCA